MAIASSLQAQLRQSRIERLKRWHQASLELLERSELPKVRAKPAPPILVVKDEPPGDPPPWPLPPKHVRRDDVQDIVPLLPEPKWFYRHHNRLYPHLEAIQFVVGHFCGVTIIDMNSERRHQKFVVARQIAYYLARRLTYKSLPEIGRRMGDRDHSTVMYGSRKIEQQMNVDPDLVDFVDGLESLLTAIEPELLMEVESESNLGRQAHGAQ